jgi:uncharacterized damage-inducible protein DinB
MTKSDIQFLYEYDRWANARVLKAASSLNSEQFTRNLGGSFPSIRNTLVHILSGEWGWLEYWKEPSHHSGFLPDLKARMETLFNPETFPNIATVKLTWMEVEGEMVEFVAGLTNESLERVLPFRSGKIKLMHLMQHLANHSTYHRGQVAVMMRQLGAEPLATDFHVFLLERDHDAATGD